MPNRHIKRDNLSFTIYLQCYLDNDGSLEVGKMYASIPFSFTPGVAPGIVKLNRVDGSFSDLVGEVQRHSTDNFGGDVVPQLVFPGAHCVAAPGNNMFLANKGIDPKSPGVVSGRDKLFLQWIDAFYSFIEPAYLEPYIHFIDIMVPMPKMARACRTAEEGSK